MGSNVAERIYTFEIPGVSELVDHGRENKRLCDENFFNRLFCRKSSSFMMDVIEWKLHVYPIGEDLKLYLRLKDNNGAVITTVSHLYLRYK
jgi:hypothetical protein